MERMFQAFKKCVAKIYDSVAGGNREADNAHLSFACREIIEDF